MQRIGMHRPPHSLRRRNRRMFAQSAGDDEIGHDGGSHGGIIAFDAVGGLSDHAGAQV